MLKRLTLKNFRQHEDRTIDLTAGLNVVRGANEAGKSTLIEAIAYALFGSKACREPLAQIVTWGKPENTLAVELVLASDGVEYIFTRSPKGAEVNYAGGRVVGQAQVSAKAQELLGSDPAVAGKLMLSSQGSIRGALAEGATKTMKLIEDLADFDVIDYLIELLQNKYVTGPTLTAEDRLTRAEAALKVAQEAALPPDTAALIDKIGRTSITAGKFQKQIDNDLKPGYEKAREGLRAAETAESTRTTLHGQLAASDRARRAREAQLAEAQKAAGNEGQMANLADTVLELRGRIRAAETAEQTAAIFRQFGALGYPDTHWEGDEAGFKTTLGQAGAAEHSTRGRIAEAQGALRVLQGQLQTGGTTCKACGQALPNAAAIEKHAAEVRAKIAEGEQLLKTLWELHAEQSAEVTDLEAVQKAARPLVDFLACYPGLVSADRNFFPPKLAWKGPAVQSGVGVGALRQQLAKLEADERAMQQAAGRVATLAEALEQDDEGIRELQDQINRLTEADKLPEARAAFEAAERAYNDALAQLTLLRAEKAEAESQIKALQAAHEQAKRGVALAETSVAVARGELDDLIFNNALLKRIKTARPMIADKLWNIVLTAVSTYFSSMRGTRSVVTRQGNQFLVDGKPVEGLSGSTLDILGLAIRLALTKTFLPMAPFLILDEPAAAMDDSRTQSTLGFLVASGFTQTLLVTHDEQSESVADNLITI